MIDDCDQLYRTVIAAEFNGDVYFPEIDWTQWKLDHVIDGIVDERTIIPINLNFIVENKRTGSFLQRKFPVLL